MVLTFDLTESELLLYNTNKSDDVVQRLEVSFANCEEGIISKNFSNFGSYNFRARISVGIIFLAPWLFGIIPSYTLKYMIYHQL